MVHFYQGQYLCQAKLKKQNYPKKNNMKRSGRAKIKSKGINAEGQEKTDQILNKKSNITDQVQSTPQRVDYVCMKSSIIAWFFFLLIWKSNQYLLSQLRTPLHLQGTFPPKACWWPYAPGITASVEEAQNKAGAQHHFFIERHQITTIIQTSIWISCHTVFIQPLGCFFFNLVSL